MKVSLCIFAAHPLVQADVHRLESGGDGVGDSKCTSAAHPLVRMDAHRLEGGGVGCVGRGRGWADDRDP